jgi:very-short-patch-repair endonuclease
LPRKRIPRDLTKARQLRAKLTLPEVLLWNLLRKSPDGVRFCRQDSVDPYVIDFYCPLAKVGLEIDGIAHDMGDNPARDVERDARIAEFGIEIMRIPASEALRSPEEVAEAIVGYCQR